MLPPLPAPVPVAQPVLKLFPETYCMQLAVQGEMAPFEVFTTAAGVLWVMGADTCPGFAIAVDAQG
jgi:hypothetical protein